MLPSLSLQSPEVDVKLAAGGWIKVAKINW
jgi:hypothetical protein